MFDTVFLLSAFRFRCGESLLFSHTEHNRQVFLLVDSDIRFNVRLRVK